MGARHGSARVTLPSDTEILITRSFEAPCALVWDALTTPQHLLRWWGPEHFPLVECSIDLREGGEWRYVARSTDGEEMAWYGTYRTIAAPGRLVTTEIFEPHPEAEALNTTTLTEVGGVTTLEVLVQHRSREHRDGHVHSGMEAGMQGSFDRLDALLAVADTTAERFRRVAGRFAQRVAEVPTDAWSNPSPCDGWSARDVVRHLLTWVPSVFAESGLSFPDRPGVDEDPVEAWDGFAAVLQSALDDPEVAARSFDAGPPGELTVEAAVGMLVIGDVLIHTWDLARAAGLDERIDEVVAASMLAGMEPMDEMLRASGHYGPRVDVDPGAPVQDRLLAFTGRRP